MVYACTVGGWKKIIALPLCEEGWPASGFAGRRSSQSGRAIIFMYLLKQTVQEEFFEAKLCLTYSTSNAENEKFTIKKIAMLTWPHTLKIMNNNCKIILGSSRTRALRLQNSRLE